MLTQQQQGLCILTDSCNVLTCAVCPCSARLALGDDVRPILVALEIKFCRINVNAKSRLAYYGLVLKTVAVVMMEL
jgi:hypothetical protein